MNEQQPEQQPQQEQEIFLHVTAKMCGDQITTQGSQATVYCGLSCMVYRTRETAEKAREISGGMVVKTVASELRPRNPDPINGDDILLCRSGGPNDQLEPADPYEFIFLGLSVADLLHKTEYEETQYTEVGPYTPEA